MVYCRTLGIRFKVKFHHDLQTQFGPYLDVEGGGGDRHGHIWYRLITVTSLPNIDCPTVPHASPAHVGEHSLRVLDLQFTHLSIDQDTVTQRSKINLLTVLSISRTMSIRLSIASPSAEPCWREEEIKDQTSDIKKVVVATVRRATVTS